MPAAGPALVLFDCDSTLSAIEGVDELAAKHGLGREVSALTADAMAGRLSLEDVYARRLDLIRPTRSDLEWLGRRYVECLVPGAREVFDALYFLEREIHIVSGGFLQAVLAVGTALGLSPAHVHAVELKFDATGTYAGFADSPLATSGGKISVCSRIMRGRPAVAVGDGVTDLEIQETGARFVGFGGVVVRPAVRDRAAEYVSEATLLSVLPHLVTKAESERLRRRAAVH